MKKGRYIVLMVFYVICVAVFVAANEYEWPFHRFAVALPVLYMSLVAFVSGKGDGISLPLGLLFSAAGDLAGGGGLFLWQVGFFFIAHIFYSRYFLKGAWMRPSLLFTSVILVAVVALAGIKVVSHIENLSEMIFVTAYIAIITLMCVSAIFCRKPYKGWYIAGAILFLLSDAVIAWSRFVAPIPYRTVLVMSSYYVAQLLFGASYVARFIKKRMDYSGYIGI